MDDSSREKKSSNVVSLRRLFDLLWFLLALFYVWYKGFASPPRRNISSYMRTDKPPVTVAVKSASPSNIVVNVKNSSRAVITAEVGLLWGNYSEVTKRIDGCRASKVFTFIMHWGTKPEAQFCLDFGNGQKPYEGDKGYVNIGGYEKVVIFEKLGDGWITYFDTSEKIEDVLYFHRRAKLAGRERCADLCAKLLRERSAKYPIGQWRVYDGTYWKELLPRYNDDWENRSK